MIIATFLDPSAQSLPLIGEYLATNNTDMVKLLTTKWLEFNIELEEKVVVASNRKRRNLAKSTNQPGAAKRLRLELIKKYNESDDMTAYRSIGDIIKREYGNYIKISEIVDDPLQWWKKNAVSFPYLSALAKVVLSIPASSASTERHFSESGGLISKKKAQLDPLNAQKIMFVHDNFRFSQE